MVGITLSHTQKQALFYIALHKISWIWGAVSIIQRHSGNKWRQYVEKCHVILRKWITVSTSFFTRPVWPRTSLHSSILLKTSVDCKCWWHCSRHGWFQEFCGGCLEQYGTVSQTTFVTLLTFVFLNATFAAFLTTTISILCYTWYGTLNTLLTYLF